MNDSIVGIITECFKREYARMHWADSLIGLAIQFFFIGVFAFLLGGPIYIFIHYLRHPEQAKKEAEEKANARAYRNLHPSQKPAAPHNVLNDPDVQVMIRNIIEKKHKDL